MAVVLRAPWGMSLKSEFDPLFMVTWDNQAQETWKLISFPKYDMPLTLSVWLPSSSPGYFKIPLDVTLSSRMHAADLARQTRDWELPVSTLAWLKLLPLCFPSKRNSLSLPVKGQQKACVLKETKRFTNCNERQSEKCFQSTCSCIPGNGFLWFLKLWWVGDDGTTENVGDNSLPSKIIWLVIGHLFLFLLVLDFNFN